MAAAFRLALVPGCEVRYTAPDQLLIHNPVAPLVIEAPSEGMAASMQQLKDGQTTESALAHTVIERDGVDGLSRFYLYFLQLRELRVIAWNLVVNGGCVATLAPISVEFAYDGDPPDPEERCVLSRFAHARREHGKLVLESPRSHAQLILEEPRTGSAVLSALSAPSSMKILTAQLPGVPAAAIEGLFELFHHAGLLSAVSASGDIQEDRDPVLRQWEFHDLLFHARSRKGRHSNPYGAVYRFGDQRSPGPAVKPVLDPHAIDLFRPDIDKLKETDRPFTRVLEMRQSIRAQGHPPIALQELGEFLYRTARVRRLVQRDGQEVAERIYPGGGAAYELEVYVAIQECSGCERGLYLYLPLEHRLSKVADMVSDVRVLVESAAQTAHSGLPQVTVILSARFQRMSCKYGSMAYASVLKDVGVLFQTMYLVATSMGLAGCALGGGNSDVFARVAGLRYEEETSVGEFILGSRRAED